MNLSIILDCIYVTQILEQNLWAGVDGISSRVRRAVFLTKRTYSTCLYCGRSAACTRAWVASVGTGLLVLISNPNILTSNKSFKALWGFRGKLKDLEEMRDPSAFLIPHLIQEIQFSIKL